MSNEKLSIFQEKAESMTQKLLEEIVKVREEQYPTRKDFGEALGIDPAMALRLEKGQTHLSIERFFLIAQLLKINPLDIMRAAWTGRKRSSDIKLSENERGCFVGRFIDADGSECLIQESRDNQSLYLGKVTHHDGAEIPAYNKMKLSRKNVADLIPLIEMFFKIQKLE